MSGKKRRKWTAAEKLRIVLTCMQPGVEVSEVCRREGINPTMYYNWKKKLMAGGRSQDAASKKKQHRPRGARTQHGVTGTSVVHAVQPEHSPSWSATRSTEGATSLGDGQPWATIRTVRSGSA